MSVNRNVLSQVRKVARDGADVTSGGKQFHAWGPADAGRGSRYKNSEEVLGDLEVRQRKWTGKVRRWLPPIAWHFFSKPPFKTRAVH